MVHTRTEVYTSQRRILWTRGRWDGVKGQGEVEETRRNRMGETVQVDGTLRKRLETITMFG